MIISVASGKGGTGKTTIAVNLAFSINEGVHSFWIVMRKSLTPIFF